MVSAGIQTKHLRILKIFTVKILDCGRRVFLIISLEILAKSTSLECLFFRVNV